MSQRSYNGMATLYLIPTPIGNMDDITIRAINIINSVEVIFAEDTRVTSLLLKHLNIKKKLISSFNYNEQLNKEKLLEYLKGGFNVGLVSDRGTPIISDPGYELAKCAIENNYNVVGLPGPTALIPALITSGIRPLPFLFYGFLNNKSTKRKQELEILKSEKATLIFYEAPHRIIDTLDEMKNIFGNRNIAISREISKKFEEVYRGTLDTITCQLVDIKGEFVIVVEGNKQENTYNNLTITEHVNLYIREGKDSKEAIKIVAKERNLKKQDVYNEYHGIK
ncbi:MAG: 16S rRNA (cytidine(1402)-2'-O)-methyltransferase [Bacilli bacterium]|nr:16S rRNA (cytidine(1402)-2'-O)-methyltransferase [Bacilli bacterium]